MQAWPHRAGIRALLMLVPKPLPARAAWPPQPPSLPERGSGTHRPGAPVSAQHPPARRGRTCRAPRCRALGHSRERGVSAEPTSSFPTRGRQEGPRTLPALPPGAGERFGSSDAPGALRSGQSWWLRVHPGPWVSVPCFSSASMSLATVCRACSGRAGCSVSSACPESPAVKRRGEGVWKFLPAGISSAAPGQDQAAALAQPQPTLWLVHV